MKSNTLILLLSALLTISCSTDKIITNNQYFGYDSFQDADKYLGEYANLFGSTSGILGLKYVNNGIGYKGGYSMIDLRLSPDDPKGEILIDDESFTRERVGIDPANRPYQFCSTKCQFYNGACFCEEDRTMQYFGQEVTLRYLYDGKLKLEESVYIPPLIEVKFPKNISEDESKIKMDKDNFIIEWNKDDRNEHGVLIGVVSTSANPSTVLDSNTERTFLQRSIKVPDNGSFKFDADVFEEISSETVVNIIVMRGRIPEVQDNEGNDYTVRFMSEFYETVQVF